MKDPMVFWVWVILTVAFLIMLVMMANHDEKVDAPRWVTALLSAFFGGAYAFASLFLLSQAIQGFV